MRRALRLLSVAFALALPITLLGSSPAAVAETSSPCAPVLFIGARGSDQDGPTSTNRRDVTDPAQLAGTLRPVYDRLVQGLGTGRRVASYSVPYAASSVTTIPLRPDVYFGGVSEGQNAAYGAMLNAALTCPRQQFVLAGYSQGAMVMHRVLRQLDAGATEHDRLLKSRLLAAILIGDGDALSGEQVQRFGTAQAGNIGIGTVLPSQSGASTVKLSRSFGSRVLSVCNRADTVCDTLTPFVAVPLRSPLKALLTALNVAGKVAVHLAYSSSQATVQAVQRAVSLVRAVPYPADYVLAGTVGVPYEGQLTADVNRDATLEWQLRAPNAPLPAGLTLSTGGAVTGTPTEAGSVTTTIEVRASAPNTAPGPWVPTPVFITIAPAAAPPTAPTLPPIVGALTSMDGATRLGFEAAGYRPTCPNDPRSAFGNRISTATTTYDHGNPVPASTVDVTMQMDGGPNSYVWLRSDLPGIPDSAQSVEFTLTCYLQPWYAGVDVSHMDPATAYAQSTFALPVTGGRVHATYTVAPGTVTVTSAQCDPPQVSTGYFLLRSTADGNDIQYLQGARPVSDDNGVWSGTITGVPSGEYYLEADCNYLPRTFHFVTEVVTVP